MLNITNYNFTQIFKKIKWPLFISAIIFILGLAGYFIILFGGKLVVDEEQLILNTTSTIETTEGEILWELYSENRKLTTLDQIPDHVKNAFIAVEDTRFYQHSGVDFKSVVRAVYRDIIAFSKVEGASTITQQLAKNLFLYNDKTWMRKTKEVMAAIYLERKFSKSEILELYLNTIYFGHGVYGIETASQKFFSKPVHQLTIAEGALLTGLAKSPNGYSPINHPEKSKNRRNTVLKVMEERGIINTATRLQEQGKTLGLKLQDKMVHPSLNSYIDLVLKEAAEKYHLTIAELQRGGYRLIVNIDELSQQIAYEKFQVDNYFPGNTDGVEATFVMMDQENGKIIAALGGRNYQIGDLNRITVKRQPGSTFKPLAVYGPALMMETYEPYSLIIDEQIDFDGYIAKNADGKYEGKISIYEAITTSKNTSSVWLLDQIGISYAKSYLEKMNISIPDQGLAIALGGLSEGVTPIEMVGGYRPFVHDGEYIEPYTISKIFNRENELFAEVKPFKTNVFSPQVAWDMTKILLKTVESGTASSGEYHKQLAGKTGSTEHLHVNGMFKDAWFVGYTPEYVTALWMGYDKSDADHYLVGGSAYPTILTKDILTEIDKQQPLLASFTKPENINDLPDPIILGEVDHVQAKYIFGGFPLLKGEISWKMLDDDRIVYRIYEFENDELIAEIKGENHFIIDKVSLFKTTSYYIVPYDPLTDLEGNPSEIVKLSF